MGSGFLHSYALHCVVMLLMPVADHLKKRADLGSSGKLASRVVKRVSCFPFRLCRAFASRAGHLAKYSVMYRLG